MNGSNNVLDVMVKNEETLAGLYRKFSYHYQDKDFWNKLSKDEMVHAQWLRAVDNNSEDVAIKESMFPLAAIKTMINSVQEIIDSADNPTLLEALSIALSYEKSMIEGKYFSIFQSDSTKLMKVFSDLQMETEGHIKFVENELQDYKIANNIIR